MHEKMEANLVINKEESVSRAASRHESLIRLSPRRPTEPVEIPTETETRMTASVLKPDTSATTTTTTTLKLNAVYYDKTQHAKFRAGPFFKPQNKTKIKTVKQCAQSQGHHTIDRPEERLSLIHI